MLLGMRFRIELYVPSSGANPVREFLREPKRTDPDDQRAMAEKLEMLEDRACHRSPLCMALSGGL